MQISRNCKLKTKSSGRCLRGEASWRRLRKGHPTPPASHWKRRQRRPPFCLRSGRRRICLSLAEDHQCSGGWHSQRQSKGEGRQAIPRFVTGPGTLLNQCRLHKTKKHTQAGKNEARTFRGFVSGNETASKGRVGPEFPCRASSGWRFEISCRRRRPTASVPYDQKWG